jgi:hypothetical protein
MSKESAIYAAYAIFELPYESDQEVYGQNSISHKPAKAQEMAQGLR